MNQGALVFAQLMQHLPLTTFRRCVTCYAGEHKVKRFSCLDQYLCMAFAQLTYRESLRDIEACLRAQASKLYHMGLRGHVARNTLANANATRLAHLLRLRAALDRDRAPTVCRGAVGDRAKGHGHSVELRATQLAASDFRGEDITAHSVLVRRPVSLRPAR